MRRAHACTSTAARLSRHPSAVRTRWRARGVLVGDLWVLTGQSNIEGVSTLIDVEAPSPFVQSCQLRERWAVAEEPLHWLGESPQLVHHRLWGRGRERVPDEPDLHDPDRTTGAGLGLAFVEERYRGAL